MDAPQLTKEIANPLTYISTIFELAFFFSYCHTPLISAYLTLDGNWQESKILTELQNSSANF